MTEYPTDDRIHDGSYSEGQLIMPFYIICDASGSMKDDLPALQRDLSELVNDIATNPLVDDTTMLSIIAFGTEARTLVPLSEPSSVTMPQLSVLGETSFSRAFEEYSRAFNADYKRLKQEGSKVFRPCVFFLTDGGATDPGTWEATFQRLIVWDPKTRTGNQMYPYIVAYGFGSAQLEQLKKIAYPNFGEKLGKWFLSSTNDVHELLKSMIGTIGKTIVSSGQSVNAGQPQLFLPPAVSTRTTLAGEPDILP